MKPSPRGRRLVGDIIRQQRQLAELPMRQLAEMVGISNPYLSQIERGLRNPSRQVLDAIASSLHTTADALMRQDEVTKGGAGDGNGPAAGSEGGPGESDALRAIRLDPRLTDAQRRALEQTYTAFLDQNDPGTP